jgi:hypothetical protein
MSADRAVSTATPACPYSTARQAADETLAAAAAAGYAGLHSLPFNRYAPDVSTWWLSPSAKAPAYQHGKIIFTQRDEPQGGLFVGFYVEKGVGPTGAGLYRETSKGRRWIMDETWLWGRFMASMESRDIGPVITAVDHAAQRPVIVAVDAAPVPPPAGSDNDIRSSRLARDVVRFLFSNGRLDPLDSTLPANVLRGLVRPQTLGELSTAISLLPELDWLWVDISIGLHLAIGPQQADRQLWTGHEIWAKACYPWRAWLQ